MKELIIVALKAIAWLPADIVNFFIEESKNIFFGAMVSQIVIFLLMVIYLILMLVCKNNERKLARIIEKFPFYLWIAFFAGCISCFYDFFVIYPFIEENSETILLADTVKVTIHFIGFNIWVLYFICECERKTETKRISQIVRKIEKEKDENKKRNLMEEYDLNEQTCRKEKLIRRYKRIFLKIACLICVAAGIGAGFFEIVGGLALRNAEYVDFGIVAVFITGIGVLFWVGAMDSMGFFDDTEEEVKKEEKQKQKVAE